MIKSHTRECTIYLVLVYIISPIPYLNQSHINSKIDVFRKIGCQNGNFWGFIGNIYLRLFEPFTGIFTSRRNTLLY